MVPVWEQTKEKLGSKIDFEQINVDDKNNHELAQKYDVHSIPRLIYTDSSDQLLQETKGGWQTVQQFELDIKDAFGDL